MTKRQPSVVSAISRAPRSQAPSGLGITYGARVIDSTPPPMNTSPSPTAMAWAAELIAWSPDPHSRLTVRPPTSTGKSGQEQRHPRDVAVVLAGLVGAAEDDVLDEAGIEPGPVDDRAQHGRGEVVRPNGCQGAAVAADRRPDGLDDPGLAEGSVRVSRHRSIVSQPPAPVLPPWAIGDGVKAAAR